MARNIARILTVSMLSALMLLMTFHSSEARGRKSGGRSVAKHSRAGVKKTSRPSSRRSRGTRRQRHRTTEEVEPPINPANYSIAPDRIEVFEYGSENSQNLSRYLKLPQPPNPVTSQEISSVGRRTNIAIESTRVIEIQQALLSRGFFNGEATGVYDDATIDAMRKFQISQKIPVTGYPTAHALKRLGLVN